MTPKNDNGTGPFSAPATASDHDVSSDDELLESLTRLARDDAPPRDLADRVLDTVQYRSRVVGGTRSLAGRSIGLGFLAGALAAAALGLVWISSQQEMVLEVEPEPSVKPVPVQTAPAASPRVAPFDPCSARRSADGREPWIDDFEDEDDALLPREGRRGLWRWVRDTDAPGTAPALLPVPHPNATADNQRALHVKGGRLREWGATVEVVFQPKCYDASVYAGIAFDAKGTGRIYMAPREVDVIPVDLGGTCEKDCHNNHVKQIELGEDFQTYEVLFSEVEQRGYYRPPLDPSRLNGIAFLIRPEDTPYDVWIDNVRFIAR